MRMRSSVLLFIPSLFLSYCASQLPPPGGPADTIPPVVIRTSPDSAAVRVKEGDIELVFSEYVDRRSVEESIFLSPPVGQMEFDWSGKELTIHIAETLKANRTYVLNLGTDVVDQRAKNRMASGFTLAFSTGDSLDQGFVRGRVYDTKPEGILIYAYILDSLDADTLNPAKHKPDYVVQTGKDGTFLLSNIALGNYRVFAVRDEYRNLLYDPQLDQYGVGRTDLALSSGQPGVDGLAFRVTMEDTTAPFLSSVQAVNDRLIRFRFNEKVDSASFAGASITIADTLSGELVEPMIIYQSYPDLRGGLVALTGPLDSSRAYNLTVLGVRDSSGRQIDSSTATLLVDAATDPDSTPAGFTVLSFVDTLLGYPVSRPIQILFSEPVDKPAAQHAVSIADTSGNAVNTETRWLNPVRLLLTPRQSLQTSTQYILSAVLDSVRDLQGNGYQDSVRHIRFTTYNPERAGELGGAVRSSGGEGEIVVTAVRSPDQWRRDVVLQGDGGFVFSTLPEGRFFLEAYLDEDGSGSYSYGLPFPFRPSERFVVGTDTVKVRPRWGAEGVTLVIP